MRLTNLINQTKRVLLPLEADLHTTYTLHAVLEFRLHPDYRLTVER